ncbi:hypothetical protein OSTOST_00680 [Ostertagia ostertagi]
MRSLFVVRGPIILCWVLPKCHAHHSRSEMSRVSDTTSYHKLMAAPIASLNSIMLQTCSPSTATATHTPVTDLTSSLACSLLSCSIPSATVISPPPPYHSINHHRPYHNLHPLFDMHNTAAIVDSDVDVIGLSHSTKQVSIRDHDSEQSDEPLDLSLKGSTPLYSPTTSRPSVIIESPTVRHPPVRRSASSVSSSREHDVHEHFRRSLSGKWPRRSKVDDEKVSLVQRPSQHLPERQRPQPTHLTQFRHEHLQSPEGPHLTTMVAPTAQRNRTLSSVTAASTLSTISDAPYPKKISRTGSEKGTPPLQHLNELVKSKRSVVT